MDFTLNFIDIEDLKESLVNLSKVHSLRELYLTGNPCESWEGSKDYIISKLPAINFLNGNEILKSERIKANQLFPFLEKELEKLSIENIEKKQNDPDKDNPNRYTKEYRRKLYKEIEEEKNDKEKQRTEKPKSPWDMDEPKGPLPTYKDNGEIRVCNQGKYDFYFNEDIFTTGILLFELKLPKHMQTTQIQVDLNPQYIRVVVKDKVTQMKFAYEIIVEKSIIQRSLTTGHLVVKCPILGYENKYSEIKDLSTFNEEDFKENKKKQNEINKKKDKESEDLNIDKIIKEKIKNPGIRIIN